MGKRLLILSLLVLHSMPSAAGNSKKTSLSPKAAVNGTIITADTKAGERAINQYLFTLAPDKQTLQNAEAHTFFSALESTVASNPTKQLDLKNIETFKNLKKHFSANGNPFKKAKIEEPLIVIIQRQGDATIIKEDKTTYETQSFSIAVSQTFFQAKASALKPKLSLRALATLECSPEAKTCKEVKIAVIQNIIDWHEDLK